MITLYVVPEIMYKMFNTRKLQLITDYDKLVWSEPNASNINPSKFQYIVFDKQCHKITTICIDSTTVSSQYSVKLLGVHIDIELNFNTHISEICKKAMFLEGCQKHLIQMVNWFYFIRLCYHNSISVQ